MRQRWDRLTFLHWQFKPADVAALLPDGLEPELFDGEAWVGLVPFFMHVATSGGRMLPWVSRFAETNVRTYVRNRDGISGIWFFSLDAARLGAVAVARSTYGLPYFWSEMDVEQSGREIFYRCHRRLPGPAASSVARIEIGDPFRDDELHDRDHFLTARWVLFSAGLRPSGGLRGVVPPGQHSGGGPSLRLARACHRPWPLHRAEVVAVDDSLIAAAGLPAPSGAPLAHFSPGVDVTIGPPERCR
jgi:uncharacterized protein YqjF (DUF2071 family)